nr:SGNH hydrolase domain-containing protein [Ramlibacter monticola]
MSRACHIGAATVPVVLLWGDSHLLAWAPVIDKLLKERGIAAILATRSACPPVLDFREGVPNACARYASEIHQYLRDHPELRTVAVAAHWRAYFVPERGGKAASVLSSAIPPVVTRSSLRSSLDQLGLDGRRVVLFGPVPVYEANVPLVKALELVSGRRHLHTTSEAQRVMHKEFYAMNMIGVRLADPVAWLCQTDCVYFAQGNSLYRDSHHLSVAGAMYLEEHVRRVLLDDIDSGSRARAGVQ